MIVREYLEMIGFLVRQPTKYQVTGRTKGAHEEPDLIALNPAVDGGAPAPGVWTGADLCRLHRGIFSIRGWHTERITPALLDLYPELLRLGDPAVLKYALGWLGSGPVTRVICLPALPSSVAAREEVLRRLQAAGIEGVLTFRTILGELASNLERNANYEKSDLLQIMRILKIYGFLRDTQMDLFNRRGRRRRTRPAQTPSSSPSEAAP